MAETNNASSSNYANDFINKITDNIDLSYQKVLVLPNDNVTSNINNFTNSIKIGKGLKYDQTNNQVIANNIGILKYQNPNYYWIETEKKYYLPRINDSVVGVVIDKSNEYYHINIFCGINCILHRLAFEGATKRNKPELNKGDIIYARVTNNLYYSDTELSCISITGSKKEWSTNETIYGYLSNGLLLQISSKHVNYLLQPECQLLCTLANYISYEVAIGMNGVIWFHVSNENILHTIIIRNAILNSQYLDNDIQIVAMVEQLITSSKNIKT